MLEAASTKELALLAASAGVLKIVAKWGRLLATVGWWFMNTQSFLCNIMLT